MVCRYLRKTALLALALILLFTFGCYTVPPIESEELNPPESFTPSGQVFYGLSVHYIDVGQGDSILICFPDGKSMLVDCGNQSASSVEAVSSALKQKNVSELDYLVLTHPDLDHIGGTAIALKDLKVKKTFHPDIKRPKEEFLDYYNVLEFLQANGSEFEISTRGDFVSGDGYFLGFLTPKSTSQSDSAYREFNLAFPPTETQTNNISPMIYLEYKGVRFLFTGDNTAKSEKELITDYNSKLYDQIFEPCGVTVNLERIDFLKVSHHGSADASCYEFLSAISPKNAIISVGGENIYGHPASSTLIRLNSLGEKCDLWRTDVKGTVSVFVSTDGSCVVKPSE